MYLIEDLPFILNIFLKKINKKIICINIILKIFKKNVIYTDYLPYNYFRCNRIEKKNIIGYVSSILEDYYIKYKKLVFIITDLGLIYFNPENFRCKIIDRNDIKEIKELIEKWDNDINNS